MDNAGPDGAISFAVVILQKHKIVNCVQVNGQRAISEQRLQQNALSGLKYIENWVSFVAFSYLDGQILVQKFPKFDCP